MLTHRAVRTTATVALLLAGCVGARAATPRPAPIVLKPARVLLVSGTQIQDDRVIDDGGDPERGDVVAIAALLKLWGVPFDVLRLDVHTMSAADVLDRTGRARYGAIVWAARQDQYPWQPQHYDVLGQAVAAGVSLVAIGDRIREPTIQRLLGVTYEQTTALCDPVAVNDRTGSHFVIRGFEGTRATLGEGRFTGARVSVAAADVATLASACGVPQVTARTIDTASRTRAIWLGGALTSFADSPTFIGLLRRALVYALGYAVYKDYAHAVLLRMDDPGCAPSAYLRCVRPQWYYRELTRADWDEKVLPALRAHHARLGVSFCAGYPHPDHNQPANTIVPSCAVDAPEWAVDCGRGPEPNPQRLASTCAGLHDGVSADLVEVQSHGYTHMQPDLTGWWHGDGKTQWRVPGWYREFHDDVHDADVAPDVQRARLTRAVAAITEEFGTPPSMLVPPGHSISGRSTVRTRVGTAARFEGPGPSIPVTLNGAKPRARYTLYVGDRPWARLGAITTDARGDASAVLDVPPRLLHSRAPRFVVAKRGATQFVAGPLTSATEMRVAVPFRSREDMSAEERRRFSFARDPLAAGSAGAGSIAVRVAGASPNATYMVRFGDATWTDVGALTTDGGGNGHALLTLPPSVLGSPPGQYFTLDRDRTQLVAGPTAARLGSTSELPLRDAQAMTPEERARFGGGVDALFGGAVSVTPYRPDHVAPTYTYMLAAESGFGVAHDDSGHYLGLDYVVTLPQIDYVGAEVGDPKPQAAQKQLDVVQHHFDRHVPAVVYHHDANVSLDAGYYPRLLERLAERWPDVAYLTPNEWSAYLHATVGASSTGDGIRIDVAYDARYGRYCATHVSTWTLHLSDELLADLRTHGSTDIVTDGIANPSASHGQLLAETHTLALPTGNGPHTIVIGPPTITRAAGPARGRRAAVP